MRMNLMKILSSTGKANVKNPKQLKYLLCPLIAQSQAEQDRFYDLFERYWGEIYEPIEEDHSKWWERLPQWFWLIPIVLVVGSLGYLGYDHLTQPTVEDPVFLVRNTSGKVGDTVQITNNSLNFDTLKTNFKWEVIHRETDAVEIEDSESKHLEYIVPANAGMPQKLIRLTSEHSETFERDTFETYFTIFCTKKPVVEIQIDKNELRAGETITLKAVSEELEAYELFWYFGKGNEYEEAEIQHTFNQVGNYRITLQATRKNADGQCETTIEKPISVGNNKAFLDLKPLEKAELAPMARFGLGTWILLGLLAIGCVYFWVRFWREQNEKPVEEAPKEQKKKTQIPDRGPYFIPFRSQESHIHFEQQLFRFADVLRQRQEGLREYINVPESLKATIESGGFPNLQFAINTTPTEYLFLIDQQSAHSHQAKLYEYLIGFLGEKDVLVETFHYNTDFHRFWNSNFPKGIHPEILRRQFTNHRLVILGDAHAMLDPFSKDKPALKKDTQKLFEQWKYRLLLTPLPEASWTYREGVLHQYFGIFPSDVEGLTEAIKQLETGREEEDFMSFDRWREQVRKSTPDPDVNYRRWRTFAEHQDYLKDHPQVFEWLCALVIYPKPTWEITIAVGHALRDFGVEVNYDNLLLLSRIPWLQTGNLKSRLRDDLTGYLSEDMKMAARQAIAEELEAVEKLVENSHASRSWETENAIQKYTLAPEDVEYQDLIQKLHQKGWFSKTQKTELEGTYYNHHYGQMRQMKQQSQTTQKFEKSNFNFNEPIDFDEFISTAPSSESLKEEPQPAAKREKPSIFTKNFYLAMTCSLLYLLITLLVYNTDGKPELDQLVFNSEHPPIYDEQNLRDYFFVKEDFQIDSAIIKNNMAVKFWESYSGLRLSVSEINRPPDIRVFESPRDFDTYDIVFRRALFNLQDAIDYEGGNYDLGEKNLARLNYNLGTIIYHMVLADSADVSSLNSARSHFKAAMKYDSTRLDGLHGMGLSYFYDVESDSTLWFYKQIKEEGEDYFLNAKVPNLETLLDLQPKIPEIAPEPIPQQQEPDNQQENQPEQATESTRPEPELAGFWYTQASQRGTTRTNYIKITATKVAHSRVYEAGKLIRYLDGAVNLADGIIEFQWRKNEYEELDFKWIDENNFEFTERMPPEVQRAPKVTRYERGSESLAAFRDEDGDSIYDFDDECPFISGTQNGKGCPDPTVLPISDAWLNGQWKGTAIVDDGSGEWTVELIILVEKGIYEVNYPSIGCSGIWEPVSKGTDENGIRTIRFRENIINNPDRACVDRGFVFARIQNGKLNLLYKNPNTAEYIATADLTKVGEEEIPIPEMVFVKGGTFTMGCTWDKDEVLCDDRENPPHEVQLDDFSIGKYEVTNEQFAAFLNDYGSDKVKDGTYKEEVMIQQHKWGIEFRDFKGEITYHPKKGYENYPVIYVTWYGATEYAKWLNQKTGQKWRLPTEAEWEYAARGGSNYNNNFIYAGSNKLEEVAWYRDNSNSETHPIGQEKQPNKLDLYDMSGNVWEWCSDWYAEDYYKQFKRKLATNPKGADSGSARMLRGGSWSLSAKSCRVSLRFPSLPDYHGHGIGFRLAHSL